MVQATPSWWFGLVGGFDPLLLAEATLLNRQATNPTTNWNQAIGPGELRARGQSQPDLSFLCALPPGLD